MTATSLTPGRKKFHRKRSYVFILNLGNIPLLYYIPYTTVYVIYIYIYFGILYGFKNN